MIFLETKSRSDLDLHIFHSRNLRIEVDILSKDGKWLEILGCGIINPTVLENCNIDSNVYCGLAFGLGLERIAMLKFGVNDIRDFYKSNLDFLEQF